MKIKILKQLSYLDKMMLYPGKVYENEIHPAHARQFIEDGFAVQHINEKEFKGEKATKEWKSIADLTK
jgi:hypothetical protein